MMESRGHAKDIQRLPRLPRNPVHSSPPSTPHRHAEFEPSNHKDLLELADKNNEIAQLRKQLAALQIHIKEMEQDSQDEQRKCENEIKKLKENLHESSKTINLLQERVRFQNESNAANLSVANGIDTYEQKISELTNQLKKEKKLTDQLETGNFNLNLRFDEQSATTARQQSRMKDLELEIRTLHQKLESSTKDNRQLLSDLKVKDDQVEDLKQHAEELKEIVDSIRHRGRKSFISADLSISAISSPNLYQNRNQDLEEDFEDMSTAVVDIQFQDAVSNANKLRAEMEDMKAELKGKIESLLDANKKLEEELKLANSKLLEEESQTSSLAAEYNEIKLVKQKEEEMHLEKLQLHEHQISDLTAELLAKEQNNEQLSVQMEDQKAEFEALEQANKKLEEELTLTNSKLLDKETQISILAAEYNEIMLAKLKEVEMHLEKFQEHEHQISILTGENTKLLTKVRNNEQLSMQMENLKAEFTGTNQSLQQANKKYEVELELAASKLLEKESQISNLSAECNEIKSAKLKEVEMHLEKLHLHEHQISILTAENNQLIAKVRTNKQLLAQMKGLKEELVALEQTNKELEEELVLANSQLLEEQSHTSSLAAEHNEMKMAKLKEEEMHFAKLQLHEQQISDLAAENTELLTKVRNNEQLSMEMENLKAELVGTNQSLQQANKKFEEELTLANSQLLGKESQISSLTAECNEIKMAKRKEEEVHLENLKLHEKSIGDLEAENTKLLAKIRDNEQLSGQMEDLKANFEALEQTNKKLEEELILANSKLLEEQSHTSSLAAEYNEIKLAKQKEEEMHFAKLQLHEQQISDLAAENTELLTKVRNNEEILVQMEDLKAECERTNESLQQTNKKFEEELTLANTQRLEKESRISSLGAECNEIKLAKLKEVEVHLEKLQQNEQRINLLESENTKLLTKVRNNEQLSVQMDEQIQEAIRKTKSEVQTRYSVKFESMKDQFKSAFAKELQEKESLIEKQKVEIVMLREMVEALRKDQAQSRMGAIELNSTIYKLQESAKESKEWERKYLQASSALHQLKLKNLSGSTHLSETSRNRSRDITLERSVSVTSIASAISNTSTGSRFKAVPNGSGTLFTCEDEEDLEFNEKNLAMLTSEVPTISDVDRVQEIQRRNTLLPPHMRSCYPAEFQFFDSSVKLDEENIRVPEFALPETFKHTSSTSQPTRRATMAPFANLTNRQHRRL